MATSPGTWRVHPHQPMEIGSGKSATNAVTGGEVKLDRVSVGKKSSRKDWEARALEAKRAKKRASRHRNR